MREMVIDVSHWDGDIDIKGFKHLRGCWGVVVKAGGFETNLGRYKDSRFEQNYNKAVACGMHVGAYYYSVATTVEAARADAEHFMQLLTGHAFDLPVYYDVEDKQQFALSPRALTDVIHAFITTLNEHGYYGGVYTGGSAWVNNMYYNELLSYADWIASWGPNWPNYAGDIGMWQQGSIDINTGDIAYADVSGNTDLDWCIVDYPSRIINGYKNNCSPEGASKEDTMAKDGTVERLMELAYDDLGYYAPADPERGSKAGRYCAALMGEDWLAGPSTEIWWCCMWVSMILDKAGVKCPGFPSQNTDVAWNGGANTRAVPKEAIRRGDILIFDWDFSTTATDHIGFATASPVNGYVNTIEGNVGNAVKEKVRPLNSIRYVIRPMYSDAAPAGIATDSTVVKNPTQNGQKLDIDGIGGYNTIYEWQSQLGTPADGEISGQYNDNYQYFSGIKSVSLGGGGSVLVEAVQRKVGAAPDGIWGKETSYKLQQWLEDNGYKCGTAGIDGYFGHDSVVALQKSLNDGKWK